MRKSNRKFGIVQLSGLLVVAFLAATPTANAGEPLCELDWNEDGVVNWNDYLQEHTDGTVSGFYVDVLNHVRWHSGPNRSQRNHPLDWNNDGAVTMDDAGGPNLYIDGSFYTQLQRFIYWYLRGYTYLYEEWYPESDCIETEEPPIHPAGSGRALAGGACYDVECTEANPGPTTPEPICVHTHISDNATFDSCCKGHTSAGGSNNDCGA